MADASKRSDSRTPGWEKAYKTPRMKAEQAQMRIKREANKACHGSWRPCAGFDHPIPVESKS